LLEWWNLISAKRCDGYPHSQEDNYNEDQKVFLIEKINEKTLNGDEMPKGLWAMKGVVDTLTSRGRNFCTRSPFGALYTSLERYI
jgi:hypothetical protein